MGGTRSEAGALKGHSGHYESKPRTDRGKPVSAPMPTPTVMRRRRRR